MKILPERTETLPLTKIERLFATMVKEGMTEDDLLLLNVNPFGRPGMTCHIVVSHRGVVVVQFANQGDPTTFLEEVTQIYIPRLEAMRGMLMARLWQREPLLDEKGDLRFPVSFIFCFPQLNIVNPPSLPTDQKLFLERNCAFYNDFAALKEKPEQILLSWMDRQMAPHMAERRSLTPLDMDLVLHCIAPEYTIPRPIPPSRNGFLQPHTSIARVYQLDDDQVQNLYLIDRGHYILLAEAGSSKSVLLISSCLRQASLHPDKNFLLICYNKNLCKFFQWQLEIAGMGNRNITCTTFHKLCADLLDKNNVRWRKRFASREEADETAAREAIQAVLRGDIKDSFYGVFIDEVQVFRQEWYKMCYYLLESHEQDEYYFVVSGDRTQTLENMMRSGRAPWQGDRSFPSYRGRSLRLNRNYRNTTQIAGYVDQFVQLSRQTCVSLGIDDDTTPMERTIRSKPFRNGTPPRLKMLSIKSTEFEASQIVSEIRRMNTERGIDLEEIAVLLFHLQYNRKLQGWNSETYAIEPCLVAKLEEEGLSYSRFYGEDRAVYGRHTGISLLTFDGALGLDYRGVIVAGMRAMGEHFKTKTRPDIISATDPERAQLNFLQNVNAITMACTRAKDELAIILPEDYMDSIYSQLLIDANLR